MTLVRSVRVVAADEYDLMIVELARKERRQIDFIEYNER